MTPAAFFDGLQAGLESLAPDALLFPLMIVGALGFVGLTFGFQKACIKSSPAPMAATAADGASSKEE